MAKVAFKQCDVERLLRAARRVGYPNPTVEKRPDGSLRLLTDAPPPKPLDALELWEAAQDAKRANAGT